MSNIHHLKTWPEYFEKVLSGKKRFELRKDDRNFEEGDYLVLREYDPIKNRYTGRRCPVVVEYLLKGGQFGIEEGNVCMSIRKLGSCL